MATRWGICSAGKISHDFMVAMKTLPPEDHQAVAVAARSLDDAKKFAKTHNIPRAYGSYEELAKDPNIGSYNKKNWLHHVVVGLRPKHDSLCADVVYIGTIQTNHLSSCLLFLNAKKPVLCEKSLAMTTKEVKEILACAKKNNVFLMEAIWARFFPAYREIRRLIAQGEIGDVRMVRSEFGLSVLPLPRLELKELGGGALLDIGLYPLQFSLMVYGGERPESIKTEGVILDTGVDETLVVTLKFSNNRMAVFTSSSGLQLHNDAIVVGSKGLIRFPSHMWCPEVMVVNGKETKYPLPEPHLPLNFVHSTGLRYEAEEVRQCLLKGMKECPIVSHADSLLLAEVKEEILKQVGVTYD
ncbi:trans-1,2-dihydrobenzene-1,2-diol dehydrogenase-like isoform X1 [Corythoichthys intestinalis]|uniref:trans-1,2-dihydrobenzene-1,2-diol dehydrogenase-like isoform X1 n=1 Tax=Corythoichthys intestinalis TaxID=161448 RepID=UPI0025A4CC7C|nr:trans-1,2-dihydrobenzene-1,2-diol dehydrogenase-like isoform X1 [Corythoichthys intestinalis]